MCGRFFRHSPRDELGAAFRAEPGPTSNLVPSYNVTPGQPVLVVRYDPKAGIRTLDGVHWGLIPHFARERKSVAINARSETVDELGSFRTPFARRRCLVLANGFFEWRAIGKRKQPYAITLMSQRPFAIAGIWDNWHEPETGEWIRSCAVLTTQPNETVAAIHDRMPVILRPEDYATWLGEEPAQPQALKALLAPFRAEPMVGWPVTPAINKPGAIADVSILNEVEVPDATPQRELDV